MFSNKDAGKRIVYGHYDMVDYDITQRCRHQNNKWSRHKQSLPEFSVSKRQGQVACVGEEMWSQRVELPCGSSHHITPLRFTLRPSTTRLVMSLILCGFVLQRGSTKAADHLNNKGSRWRSKFLIQTQKGDYGKTLLNMLKYHFSLPMWRSKDICDACTPEEC